MVIKSYYFWRTYEIFTLCKNYKRGESYSENN